MGKPTASQPKGKHVYKKSKSSAHDGECVEVSLPEWRKSTHSLPNGDCVEVAGSEGMVLVRHSKQREPVIAFTPPEWAAFLAGVKGDEFDLTVTE